VLIAETGPVAERLRTREIDDDEGRRLLRIVHGGSGMWSATSPPTSSWLRGWWMTSAMRACAPCCAMRASPSSGQRPGRPPKTRATRRRRAAVPATAGLRLWCGPARGPQLVW